MKGENPVLGLAKDHTLQIHSRVRLELQREEGRGLPVSSLLSSPGLEPGARPIPGVCITPGSLQSFLISLRS